MVFILSTSSYTNKTTAIMIVIAVLFLGFGYFMGEEKSRVNSALEYMDEVMEIYMASDHALDTARATYMFLDYHASLQALTLLNPDLQDVMYRRQTFFAERTVNMLDLALEKADGLKPSHSVSKTDILLLQNKVNNLHQLAIQLRTIAYKNHITEDDVDHARAIVNNMESLTGDIHQITLKIINEVS